MNLIEAFKTGKNFKRKGWTTYCELIEINLNVAGHSELVQLVDDEDFEADDWEVEK